MRTFSLLSFLLLSTASLALVPACDSGGDDGNSDASGDGDGDGDGDQCTQSWVDKPNAAATPIQQTWGAACSTDDDCKTLLGYDNAYCIKDILSVYELPEGYCSRPCDLPDADTKYIPNDPTCEAAGGVDCIGLDGFFESCAVPCSEDSECNRDPYACTIMPVIATDGDQTYCLMNPNECCLDPSMCS